MSLLLSTLEMADEQIFMDMRRSLAMISLCLPHNFFDDITRQLEVKHGRIAMAATLGMLVQENYRFEGFLSPSANLKFADVPNGLAALDVVPLSGWVQMAIVIGLHEFLVKERPGKAPGDFGTGYFGVALDDQSAKQLRLLVSGFSSVTLFCQRS